MILQTLFSFNLNLIAVLFFYRCVDLIFFSIQMEAFIALITYHFNVVYLATLKQSGFFI